MAGADPTLVERLGTWGDLVGDAFALRDDVLGVWGDPQVTGKPAGDDLLAGKPTVLLVWAAEMLAAAHRPLLEACDAGTLDGPQVVALREAMQAAGVRERAELELTDLVDRSHAALDDLDVDGPSRAALAGLAEAVAWRSV
ncbi:hypothetical protein G7075_19150 [Phycicoccus sp. HDW14]|nr:hypothetical protein G7075_19150 [Phycicoccus sp. HDW14]